MLQAWYLSGENEEVTIGVNEEGDPDSGPFFITHIDLNDNIDFQTVEGFFHPHNVEVAGRLSTRRWIIPRSIRGTPRS